MALKFLLCAYVVLYQSCLYLKLARGHWYLCTLLLGNLKHMGRKCFFYSLVSSLFRDVSSMNFITLISLIFIMLGNRQDTEQENGSLMCFSITSSLAFVCITFFSYDSVPHRYHFHTPDSTCPPHYTFLIPVIKHLPYMNVMLEFLLLINTIGDHSFLHL